MRDLPVKWGISLANRGALFGLTDVDDLIETAVAAEESGVFESVWVGDSLIHKPRLDSIVMLSAAATRTEKVRLGTICLASFPVRHPVLLAIQWASLDQLSKGRTILGVCIGGGHEGEMRAFGVQKNERVGRLTEGIKLLRKIWSDEEVNHRGKYFTLEGYRIVPKPAQKPCPIWIAVSPDRAVVGDEGVARAMKRVATLGDGYISMPVAPEEMARRLDLIENTLAKPAEASTASRSRSTAWSISTMTGEQLTTRRNITLIITTFPAIRPKSYYKFGWRMVRPNSAPA